MTASVEEMTAEILNDDTVTIGNDTYNWSEVAQD